jgi:hypothetical protein
MSAKLISRIPAYDILIARCFLFIIGGIATWWGIVGFSVFWQQSSVERMANQIIAGQPFRGAALTQRLPVIETIERAAWCRPAALRGAAIIRLRMVEAAASTGDHKPADKDLTLLGEAIRRSLSCLPADPFLWLVLYWVESTQNGFKPEYLNYLRMSYQLGPNEGWIAFKRSPIAFANFALLPPDLATDAVNEFLGLIKSELYGQAIEIFSGPAWQARETILPHLATLPRRNREAFARVVSDRGIAISIPGVDPPKSHPWQ